MRLAWCVLFALAAIVPARPLNDNSIQKTGSAGKAVMASVLPAGGFPGMSDLVRPAWPPSPPPAELPQLALLNLPEQAVRPRAEAKRAEPAPEAEPQPGHEPKPEPQSRPAPPPQDDDFEPLVRMEAPDGPPTTDELCAMLEAEANVRGLPAEFFVRLIWQESRFKIRAVSHVGAQGIAQFMPATARDRGLDDPYDPVEALGESARLLSDLKEEFGNVGLAAAAYNAGPGRVQRWLDGRSSLPRETRDYVKIVTGLPAEEWKSTISLRPVSLRGEEESVQNWCRTLPVHKARKPQIVEAKANEGPAVKPWGVQLAGGFSKKKATAWLASAKTRHNEVLSEHELEVVRKREAGRGRKPLYAVRISIETREAADALCSRFKEDGGSCTVMKN